MPIKVFGNSSSSYDNGNKTDTSLFVQKHYLKTNYIDANIEEDIDLKNQYRIKKLPDPISIREATSKHFVDNLFNDPTILKNTDYIDLNDRNITNARFIQVNHWPQIDSHLTANLYVDTEIDQASLVRNYQDNDFINNNLTYINSITLNKQAENDNIVITKAYVDQFHNNNERTRRDLGLDFSDESKDLVKNNQDNDLNNNKLTNIGSITINKNPSSDNELTNKNCIDDEIVKNAVIRFNQTLEIYLKVSVGNDTYILTKYDKINITDVTEIRWPNGGNALLQKWILKCVNIIYSTKIITFLRSTTTTSPTGASGPTSKPSIGWCYMYVETSGANHGANDVTVSWERIDNIHLSNIKFYYKRFSSYDPNLRSMGRFRIQLILEDNTLSTIYNIDKNSQYSNGSTVWYLFDLDITQGNYGVKFIYDQIPTAHSDMSFSNIIITHSVKLLI